MLDATLDYVKTREQFDRPIGSFQVLQHRLVDMSLLYERAWSSVYWAAMAIDDNAIIGTPPRRRAEARANLDFIAAGARRYGTGWAGGAWFVPILSLFRPVQIVNDIRRGAAGGRYGALVGFWWAAFLVQGWWGFFASRAGRNTDDPTTLRYATTSMLIGELLTIIGAILAVAVAGKLTRAVEECARSAPAPQPSQPRFERQAWPEPEPGSPQPPYPAG